MVAAKIENMRHGGDERSDQDTNLHLDLKAAAIMLNISVRLVASAAIVRRRKPPLRSPRDDESKQESDGHGMDGRLARHLSQLSPEN
jgi:hypothetical protein